MDLAKTDFAADPNGREVVLEAQPALVCAGRHPVRFRSSTATLTNTWVSAPYAIEPDLVKDFDLELRHNGAWKKVAEVRNNHHRRCAVSLAEPLNADAVRLVVRATNGTPRATVQEDEDPELTAIRSPAALDCGLRGASVKIDGDIPGGNIVVDAIDGDPAVLLHQDLRDTAGDWFYWHFRVRAPPLLQSAFNSPVPIRSACADPASVPTQERRGTGWGLRASTARVSATRSRRTPQTSASHSAFRATQKRICTSF